MTACWQFALQRKKSLSVAVLVYLLLVYFIYALYWKQSPQGVVQLIEHRVLELDIHPEDYELGQTGVVAGEVRGVEPAHGLAGSNTVAMGLGITSKGVKDATVSNIAQTFQLFHTFLPTFCTTASRGYNYWFYLAYDFSDPLFKQVEFLDAFRAAFKDTTSRLCGVGENPINTSIHMVQCSHAGKPAWAQNDAMLEAYLDNVEYYYRINDDTKLLNAGWTDAFIDVLKKYSPTKIGVVGPNHSGGNTGILTYDFVNRFHVDVFGFYYPRLFTDWWGDNWVTNVYEPGRMTKVHSMHLAHTLAAGQRYHVVSWDVGNKLKSQVAKDRLILKRYVNYTLTNNGVTPDKFKPDGRKVISISLFGRDPRYTWGAIRNAQTVQLYFPSWTYRVYVPGGTWRQDQQWAVPKRVLTKLRQLGANVVSVKSPYVPPHMWRYLVVDSQTVEHFLVRDADTRFSDREAFAVKDWLVRTAGSNPGGVIKSVLSRGFQDMPGALYCTRDHPDHFTQPIVEGLWGGRVDAVRAALRQQPISTLITRYVAIISDGKNISYSINSTLVKGNFLVDVLWSQLESQSFCHDSYCASAWPGSVPFPVAREKGEHLGRRYDAHQEPTSTESLVEVATFNSTECTWKIGYRNYTTFLSSINEKDFFGNAVRSSLGAPLIPPVGVSVTPSIVEKISSLIGAMRNVNNNNTTNTTTRINNNVINNNINNNTFVNKSPENTTMSTQKAAPS